MHVKALLAFEFLRCNVHPQLIAGVWLLSLAPFFVQFFVQLHGFYFARYHVLFLLSASIGFFQLLRSSVVLQSKMRLCAWDLSFVVLKSRIKI